MESISRYWAEIDLDALTDNAKALAAKSGKELICVIKADAYGHGDYPVTKELERIGVHNFAVSNLQEAMGLREKGIRSDLLIFGTTPKASFGELVSDDLIQTVYSLAYAKELSDYAVGRGVKVRAHLKLDTGMGRMGFRCCDGSDATKELEEVLVLPGLSIEGIYTHFSSADSTKEEDVAYTHSQYDCFEKQVRILLDKGYTFSLIHCQNSGGILWQEAPCCNACRPGIVLYGLSPSSDEASPVPLKPVMSLHATVTDVKTLPVGAFVSYGRNFEAKEITRSAIVPVGYADGYFRSLHGGDVLIGGRRFPTIGNICMDQFMVNVTDSDLQSGAECVLMGRQGSECITAEELAQRANTIPYEIICSVSRRVPRRYRKAGRDAEEISYL